MKIETKMIETISEVTSTKTENWMFIEFDNSMKTYVFANIEDKIQANFSFIKPDKQDLMYKLMKKDQEKHNNQKVNDIVEDDDLDEETDDETNEPYYGETDNDCEHTQNTKYKLLIENLSIH